MIRLSERIPYKVVQDDMLAYLSKEPDNLLCILACGIEDCILPDQNYRKGLKIKLFVHLKEIAFF